MGIGGIFDDIGRERHPESKLAPEHGTFERVEWQQWIVYLSNALMSTYRLWFYPLDLGATEHAPEVRISLQRKIEGVWDQLDAQLSADGPYLLGKEFSSADLLVTMLMRWSRNMPRPATGWPALKRLADLVRERPSCQNLYELERLDGW